MSLIDSYNIQAKNLGNTVFVLVSSFFNYDNESVLIYSITDSDNPPLLNIW